jgi:hypothetical protein
MTRTTALLALAAFAAPAQDDFSAGSFKGKTPPELVSEAGHWINATEALALEKLRGKVVWLEFSFIN